MTYSGMPFVSTYTRRVMVNSVDNLATQAGVEMLRRGGSAADAAIAANAVLAVVLQNQCGLGGDLFALVHGGGTASPVALNASGRSGSGADVDALRAAGLSEIPATHDVRAGTVPGCVDGWSALHQRFGQLEMAEILGPAIGYAREGFPTSPYYATVLKTISDTPAGRQVIPAGPPRPGQVLRQPGLARTLEGIANQGRAGFYQGEFGESLVKLGAGLFTAEDLRDDNAAWVTPLSRRVWGHDLWAPPPSSQGYLALSSAWIADGLGLPADSDDPAWAHLLIEASRQAAYDRLEVLYDGADGAALLSPARLEPRMKRITDAAATEFTIPPFQGGTTYLSVVDGNGLAISLMESLTMAFGSQLVVGDTGVFLHNRGIGFSLEQGHPNEYGPRKRPAHTLAPAMITRPDGSFFATLGSRGGDIQPQVVLQLAARLLANGQDPAEAVAAPRWALRGIAGAGLFSVWQARGSVLVGLEAGVPESWQPALKARGHAVEMDSSYSHAFGHAQVVTASDGYLAGAADPRALSGAVGGF
jgi:gamma-glutamyltranspeptidase/glutathione hydrolase